MRFRASLIGAALLAAVLPAQAGLVSGQDIIAAPSSMAEDVADVPSGAFNDHQQAFNEAQGVLLTRDIRVDGYELLPHNIVVDGDVYVAAGTRVDSHMIFLNTPERESGARDRGVTWTFDGAIVGVMSDFWGVLEMESSDLLGAPGTYYPTGPFRARGLERNDGYVLGADGFSLTLDMSVSEPGDWIRVLTASPGVDPNPEPGSLVLVLLAGAGVAVARRRRRSAV